MRRILASALLLLACAAGAEAQQPRVAEVQIAPRFLRMRVDAEAPLVATAYDADGMPVDTVFQWWSSNLNVATVSPEGLVRALAPGVAVVTAAAGTGAARRVGQVTVFVLRPGQHITVAPVPATPRIPPAGTPQPAPRTPPAGVWVAPPAPPSAAHIDSMVRASIDCSEPFLNAINPARACYDERAHLVETARLVLPVSVKTSCPYTSRTVVSALVLVLEDGRVEDVRLYAPTGCTVVDSTAEQAARALTFTPAQREGRPHRSWVRLQLRAEP